MKDAYADFERFRALNISWTRSSATFYLPHPWNGTLLLWASSDTDSLNFPRQTSTSCSFPTASGARVRLKSGIIAVPQRQDQAPPVSCKRLRSDQVNLDLELQDVPIGCSHTVRNVVKGPVSTWKTSYLIEPQYEKVSLASSMLITQQAYKSYRYRILGVAAT